MNNLSELINAAARANPQAKYGTCAEHDSLVQVLERARAVAAGLNSAGLDKGDTVVLLGQNSAAYMVAWLATQLAGIKAALVNPSYPDELLEAMLESLQPAGFLWLGRPPGGLIARPGVHVDLTAAWSAQTRVLAGARPAVPASSGADLDEEHISSFVHTSGTSGVPKFCALSHAYFLRLGRFIADSLCLTRFDTVLAPLPLFHVNPLGYGVCGSLTAQASCLSMERFVAADFWPQVKEQGVTALVLHVPPVSLLKAKTSRAEAAGHRVRVGFPLDPEFLQTFDVPLGISGYGSTEAAGLTHSWHIRPPDTGLPVEGSTQMAGRARSGLEWKLGSNDEILVRARHPGTLFSGYVRAGRVEPAVDADGWFHSGDRGRVDASGNLIFAERMSESIRVNGEYVPIGFVETRLAGSTSLGDFAIWRVDSPTHGHAVVLYSTSAEVDHAEIRSALADLPRYMRPEKLIQVERLPRDGGVGKVQRRLLGEQAVLSQASLAVN